MYIAIHPDTCVDIVKEVLAVVVFLSDISRAESSRTGAAMSLVIICIFCLC